MKQTYLLLASGLFLLAGYYGAVRAILLDSPLEWIRRWHQQEGNIHHVAYWRRILRMNRLLLVGLGCFFLVAGSSLALTESQASVPAYTAWIVWIGGSGAAWLLGYTLWLRLGRAFPALVAVRAFPVRLAEWLLTPLYWLLEPFMDYPGVASETGRHAGRMPSVVRDDTAAADDTDEQEKRVEARMFSNALDFKDVRIRDCMIPRTEITAVPLNESIEELRKAFISSGHSKIVIFRDSIDDVVGYCHSLALFRKPREITTIVTPILIVPEAMPASDLMLRFLEERKSLALVVDEFGGTSGLVSVEDVVEQIFGEIQDEYDSTEDWTERQISENAYLLSARHEVDYLNDKFGWDFPEGDYDTLAGLLIHLHGDLPKTDDVIELLPYRFQVVSMEDTRIGLVKLEITDGAGQITG